MWSRFLTIKSLNFWSWLSGRLQTTSNFLSNQTIITVDFQLHKKLCNAAFRPNTHLDYRQSQWKDARELKIQPTSPMSRHSWTAYLNDNTTTEWTEWKELVWRNESEEVRLPGKSWKYVSAQQSPDRSIIHVISASSDPFNVSDHREISLFWVLSYRSVQSAWSLKCLKVTCDSFGRLWGNIQHVLTWKQPHGLTERLCGSTLEAADFI